MESTNEATTATKPVKTFRLENVSVSVFANEHEVKGNDVTFYNVTASKTYKKGEKVLRTQSFGADDLGVLKYLLSEADDFVRSRKLDSRESND